MPEINFDIKAVLEKMKLVLQTEIVSSSPAVMSAIAGYIKDGEERFANLAEGMLSGELSWKFVAERLKEEPTNIKAEILSVSQILGADIEELAKKAITVFEDALKELI